MPDENIVHTEDIAYVAAPGPVPLLELRDITKNFGGVRALDRVSLKIFPGEVVALVGDNGAGKSTFLKVISGINIPDEGAIYSDGHPVVIRGPRDAMTLGIQTVYQDLALCDNLDTVQNLFLGREVRLPWFLGGRLPRDTQRGLSKRAEMRKVRFGGEWVILCHTESVLR